MPGLAVTPTHPVPLCPGSTRCLSAAGSPLPVGPPPLPASLLGGPLADVSSALNSGPPLLRWPQGPCRSSGVRSSWTCLCHPSFYVRARTPAPQCGGNHRCREVRGLDLGAGPGASSGLAGAVGGSVMPCGAVLEAEAAPDGDGGGHGGGHGVAAALFSSGHVWSRSGKGQRTRSCAVSLLQWRRQSLVCMGKLRQRCEAKTTRGSWPHTGLKAGSRLQLGWMRRPGSGCTPCGCGFRRGGGQAGGAYS